MEKKTFDTFVNKLVEETPQGANKYSMYGFEFNPFSRSGSTNKQAGDIYNEKLSPYNDKNESDLLKYFSDAFSKANSYAELHDQFISATILGDYGSGKTQLLMYGKSLLNSIYASTKIDHKPFSVYIGNPGGSVLGSTPKVVE